MSLDKFKRTCRKKLINKVIDSLIRTPITSTSEGNVNCGNWKQCNVKKPELSLDDTHTNM